jgi:hypothetical protein
VLILCASGPRNERNPGRRPKGGSRNPRAASLCGVFVAKGGCLDWILVRGRRHLERVLHAYAEHYNAGRPHRGLDLAAPEDEELLSICSVAHLACIGPISSAG